MEISRYRDSGYGEVWALHNLALESTGCTSPRRVDDNLHDISGNYLEGAVSSSSESSKARSSRWTP